MASVLVIDASVAVRLVTYTRGQHDWGAELQHAALVLAPESMLTEVANALWKQHRSNALQTISPQVLLADARELVDAIEPDRTLQVEALALACHLDHPVSDCLYLALARRQAARLLTADQRLQHLASQVLP